MVPAGTVTTATATLSLVRLLPRTLGADSLNAAYFRRGLTCTLTLTNDLIDGGQPRAKPHLRKAKPNHRRYRNRF